MGLVLFEQIGTHNSSWMVLTTRHYTHSRSHHISSPKTRADRTWWDGWIDRGEKKLFRHMILATHDACTTLWVIDLLNTRNNKPLVLLLLIQSESDSGLSRFFSFLNLSFFSFSFFLFFGCFGFGFGFLVFWLWDFGFFSLGCCLIRSTQRLTTWHRSTSSSGHSCCSSGR